MCIYSMINICLVLFFYIWTYSFPTTNCGRYSLLSIVYIWNLHQISDGCGCVYPCFGSSILFHWSILSLIQDQDIFIIIPVWYKLKARVVISPTIFFFLPRITLVVCVICGYKWVLGYFSYFLKNFVGILSGAVLNQ